MSAPAHVRRLRATLVAVCARALFLGRRRTREDNRVVFVGRSIVGNLAAFADFLAREHREVEIAFLMMVPDGALPTMRARILSPLRLNDLAVVARSRAVLTAEGPASLRTWLASSRRPLFVDVWHGVGFKARIASSRSSFREYDAHFVSSPHSERFYERSGARALVTGYARMDALVNVTTDSSVPARLTGVFNALTGPFVLFAPSWGLKPELDDRSVLVALNELAGELGLRIGYRPHHYSTGISIDDLGRVRSVHFTLIPNADDLLPEVDVLLTDWSSIATDFLALNRPIVYIDAPPPTNSLGPLTEHDRPGAIVSTGEELIAAVRTAATAPAAALAEYAEQRAATVDRAWGATLDGRSNARYLDAIETLERAR